MLVRRIATIWVPETLAERVVNTAESEALAAHIGDPIGRFWSADFRICTAIESADLAEVTRGVQVQKAVAAETGQPILKWRQPTTSVSECSSLAMPTPRKLSLEDILRLGLDTGQPDVMLTYGAMSIGVRLHQGRLGELVDPIVELLKRS